jgi:hypothetical protein
VLQRRPGRPLVVRPLDDDEVRARRQDLVRERLDEVARMVAQLGLGQDEAVELWRRALASALPTGTARDEESQT